MNADELKHFVGYWQKQDMLTQRVGWMYGYYVMDSVRKCAPFVIR